MNESKEKVTIKVSVGFRDKGVAVVRRVDLEQLKWAHDASALLQLEIAAAAAAVAASAGVIAAEVAKCSSN